MNERNNHPSFSGKVVDLKPRGGERTAHSQFGHFTPDDELLQSTARIKNQRDILSDRLAKMNQAQTRVSKTVFDKVCRDYSLQLETINDLLLEKKHLVKEEIKKLYINREKLSFEINRHKEILEEAEFRHFLGEFTQSQYQEVENYETKDVEKLESDLAHISQWIRTHEELFDPEDFGHKKPEKKSPLRTEDTATKTAPHQKALTDKPVVEAKKTRATEEPTQTAIKPNVPVTPQKATLPAGDAYEPQPPEPKAATPAIDETASNVDDFAYLFDEEGSMSGPAEFFGNTENNIQALLVPQPPENQTLEIQTEQKQVPQPTEARQAITEAKQVRIVTPSETVQEPNPENDELSLEVGDLLMPEPDDDYYTKENLSDPSLNMSRREEESVTSSKDMADDFSRKVVTPNPEKPVNRDDSISNILDSIRLDDEDAGAKIDTAMASDTDIQTEFKLTMTQGDLDTSVFPVRDNTSIGRSPSNDIVLKEPKVSRQHAAINKYNEHYILIDLKSSNGVYVNGAKVDEIVLHPGDEISIGGYKFVFQKSC